MKETMTKKSVVSLGLVFGVLLGVKTASGQQYTSRQPDQAPWIVSVAHTMDMYEFVERTRSIPKTQVGVMAAAPSMALNITTGLVLDDQGHVVTRLVTLNPEDKNPTLIVTGSDGRQHPAHLVGLDCATGFAVLEAPSLKMTPPDFATAQTIRDEALVRILSTSVVPRADATRQAVQISPALTVAAGRISSTSRYSHARGALALYSYRMLAKNDGSVVTNADNKVLGIAQFAGPGRAHMYPIEFIRGTVVKRILDKKDTVPAGWLGVVPKTALRTGGLGNVGVVVSEVQPDSPAAKCGLLPNDIIVGLDDVEVRGTYDLSAVLAPSAAGRRIKLRAVREQKSVEVEVELAARDCNIPILALYEHPGDSVEEQYRQIEKRLVDLTILSNSYANIPSLREQGEALREIEIEMKQLQARKQALLEYSDVLGANIRTPPPGEVFPGFTAIDLARQPQLATHFGAGSGLFVDYVTRGSAADVAGLKAGDVIIGLAGREHLGAEELKRTLSRPRGSILIRALRNKNPVELKISYPEPRSTTKRRARSRRSN